MDLTPPKKLRKHVRRIAAMPSLPLTDIQYLDNTLNKNSFSLPEISSQVKSVNELLLEGIKQKEESNVSSHKYGRSSDTSQYSRRNIRPSKIHTEPVKRSIDDISKDIENKLKLTDSQQLIPELCLSPRVVRIGVHSKRAVSNGL
ncbi:hypothetical protein EDI_092570 [Entamoeba dispar SAW760]|uniref:Uncharacterized protein n=1 Tax=Entamoeba dispar (strain ATCC PRA-260 / SAW760) TaxID=370354 RepID=B0ED49_ENTDS|nr:uncharacterized protein EDI_092570 [Entamoeba dispar SAW760]EDR27466.1 hypothetical protein EDI_092570 [Entamoeba dispar SAW760]|eukprot:EDR27466.1 hypothetical protein EDI_092570 [Entamoeba dispar SAW760]